MYAKITLYYVIRRLATTFSRSTVSRFILPHFEHPAPIFDILFQHRGWWPLESIIGGFCNVFDHLMKTGKVFV